MFGNQAGMGVEEFLLGIEVCGVGASCDRDVLFLRKRLSNCIGNVGEQILRHSR